MDPNHHRYPPGVHLSALTERNSRRVWSDDASDVGKTAITRITVPFLICSELHEYKPNLCRNRPGIFVGSHQLRNPRVLKGYP